MADLSKHIPMAESLADRTDDAGRMARSFLAAMRENADLRAQFDAQREHLMNVHAEWVRIEAELTARAEAVDYSGGCEDDYDGELFTPLAPVVAFIDDFFAALRGPQDELQPNSNNGLELKFGPQRSGTARSLWSTLCPGQKGYENEPDCGTCWGCQRAAGSGRAGNTPEFPPTLHM